MALAFLIVVGLAGLGYGAVTVRPHWPKTNGRVQVAGLNAEVSVVRDDWDIPHIYAANVEDLFFVQGYVHAQDRFWQMEFWRRIGSGRLSEILGEAALDQDRFIRTVAWHRAAARDLERLEDEARAALAAYARGVNAHITTHRRRLGLKFTILGLTGTRFEPQPWTPLHTVSWGKATAWDLSGNRTEELVRASIAARLGSSAVNVPRALNPPAGYIVTANNAVVDADHPYLLTKDWDPGY